MTSMASGAASPTRGPQEFGRQAVALGVDNVAVVDDWVYFDLEIPAGALAGQTRRIAAQVPGDFPDTPPPGPHVSPATTHPAGAVHASTLEGSWCYWSRPTPNWAADRSVKAWLRHVNSLFAQITNV